MALFVLLLYYNTMKKHNSEKSNKTVSGIKYNSKLERVVMGLTTGTPVSKGIRDQTLKKAMKDANQFVQDRFTELLPGAMQRVAELVESDNETVATRNAHYIIDRVAGMATKKQEIVNINLTAEMLLSGQYTPTDNTSRLRTAKDLLDL